MAALAILGAPRPVASAPSPTASVATATAVATPTSLPTPSPVSPAATVTTLSAASPLTTAATAQPSPTAITDVAPRDDGRAPSDDASPPSDGAPAALALPTALPPAPPVPRVFRTPVRNVPVPFVAPQADAPPPARAERAPDAAAPGRMPAGSRSVTVVFRAVARTAIEGFDLLVTYPLAAGDFVGSGDQVDCTASGQVLFTANDRDDGTLRVLVASAQTLPFPLAISCRFGVADGGAIGAGSFGVRVGEVVVNGRPGDTSLLTVSVDVR